jgi:hypothetical protein
MSASYTWLHATGQVLKTGIFSFDIDGKTVLDNTTKYFFGKDKRWVKAKAKSLYLIKHHAMTSERRLEVQLKALDGG